MVLSCAFDLAVLDQYQIENEIMKKRQKNNKDKRREEKQAQFN